MSIQIKKSEYKIEYYVKRVQDEDTLVIVEDDENFTVESEINQEVSDIYKKQKVVVDKSNLSVKEVTLYGEDDVALMNVVFDEFNFSPNLEASFFDEKMAMETAILEYGDSFVTYEEREFYTPTYVVEGSSVTSSSVIDDEVSIIEYGGDYSYTVVQRFVDFEDQEESIRIYSDLVLVGDTYGALTNNTLSFYKNGVEYVIFSQDLSSDEMINVALSIEAASEV